MAPPTLTQLSSSGPAHSVQDGEAITYLCANQPLIVVLKFREIDSTPNMWDLWVRIWSRVQTESQESSLSVCTTCHGLHDHLHRGGPAEVILIFDLVWLPLFSLLLPMKVLMVGSF